jgi:hypothetical protein
MHMNRKYLVLVPAVLLVGACATIPEGPGVLVLPGTGKSFDEFRANDFECRQFASSQIGGSSPNDAAVNDGVKSAAVGAAVGAAAGALLGGSRGAGSGAGAGLIVGGLAGSGSGQQSGRNLQQRYDFAYQQCMYARGNRVPVSGRFDAAPRGYAPPAPQQPAAVTPPPPPPGSPPPPPPSAR